MPKIKGVFIKLGTKLDDGPFSFALDTSNIQVQSLKVTPNGDPHSPGGCTHSFSLEFTIDNVSAGPKTDGYDIDEIQHTCAQEMLTFWAFKDGSTELKPDSFGATIAGDGHTPKASLGVFYVMSTGKVNNSAGVPVDHHKLLNVFRKR